MTEMNQTTGGSSAPKLESMNFGTVLDRAINLYIKNFALFLGIMIIPEGLTYLSGFLSNRITLGSPYTGAVLYAPVSLLLTLLLFGISSGAMTIAVSNRYLGKQISIIQAYRAAFRKLGTIIGAWIVAWILIVLGLMVIVPGIMLAISFCLITPVIMLENLTAGTSRKRSRQLIKGFRWQTLGLFLIYFVIQYTFYYGAIFLVILLTGSVESIFFSTSYIHQLASAPIQVILSPFPAVLSILIYYNQRIRKEGFDLVLLAETLVEE